METEGNCRKILYSLMALDDFKEILEIDDREDKMSRFCLVTATYTIEQYCKRQLLRKKHFERIDYTGDLLLPLQEYPVQEILAVYTFGAGELLEDDFYQLSPDCRFDIDVPCFLSLSPALLRYRKLRAVKVVYWSGYAQGSIPPDLAAACMELAVWNMNRYRSRRIGIVEHGKGESLEQSIPVQVRELLEPYRRKGI